MGAKFFCNKCGIEIFQGMSQEMKETETIAMVEIQCICLDCILKKEKSVLESIIANIIKLKFLNYVERFKW